MSRISSMFFILALILYYVPKVFKIKNKIFSKIHIVAGLISIVSMLIAFALTIGGDDFIKYLGFSTIMIGIGVSGYLIRKNELLNRKLHLTFTLAFFVYLFVAIKL